MDTFMYNLANGHPHEPLLYLWIDKLYAKNKSSEDAVQLIYKVRNIFLLQNKVGLCSGPKPIVRT